MEEGPGYSVVLCSKSSDVDWLLLKGGVAEVEELGAQPGAELSEVSLVSEVDVTSPYEFEGMVEAVSGSLEVELDVGLTFKELSELVLGRGLKSDTSITTVVVGAEVDWSNPDSLLLFEKVCSPSPALSIGEEVIEVSILEELGSSPVEEEVGCSLEEVDLNSSLLSELISGSLLEIVVSVGTVNVGVGLDESQVG